MEANDAKRGFHACGQYYQMGEPQEPYIYRLKTFLLEIREAAINYKNLKP